MSDETCTYKNPLSRGGTSQDQRLLKALLPDYVAVDERNMKDLIEFAQKYASEIQYYAGIEDGFGDIKCTADGNWEDFFAADDDLKSFLESTNREKEGYDEAAAFDQYIALKEEKEKAHFALFFAFLKLFQYAQNDLNTLTERHLDFFYREVLEMEAQAAVPDQVVVIMELAKHVEEAHKITKGTKLTAGKDDTGVELIYETDREIAVNKAQISELKALRILSNTINNESYRLYASPTANSADGKGAEIETDDKSWKTFGNTSRDEAEIGFAFASPILFLGEGRRTVTITLEFDNADDEIAETLSTISHIFGVEFSGETEWIGQSEDVTQGLTGTLVSQAEAEAAAIAFLNDPTTTAEDIAGTVQDDPTTGYGDQIDDPGVGLLVANRIISERPVGGYTNLAQVQSLVFGFGQDKTNDMLYTFRFGDTAKVESETTLVDNTLTIVRTITENQEAIVAYNEEVLGDPIDTKWPVAKVTLNTGHLHDPYAYKEFKNLKLIKADIEVCVEGIQTLILQNDQSQLDPTKVYNPFSNRPVNGSNFFIGSTEVFQKHLDTLDVNLTWHGLPEDANGFDDYYEAFNEHSGVPTGKQKGNDAFTADVSILDKKQWVTLDDDAMLFSTDGTGGTGTLNPQHTISFSNLAALGGVERDVEMKEVDNFDTATTKGFIRLQLNDIDFGHKDYQSVYTTAVLKAVTDETGFDGLPKEPYTPQISAVSLDYISKETLYLDASETGSETNTIEQYFHVHPFGAIEIETAAETVDFLPQYDNAGALYIGLKDLDPPSSLSMLLQVSEGSTQPDSLEQTVSWSYLTDEGWEEFSEQEVLSDSTNNLLTSGVVSLNIPKTISNTNTAFTKNLHWLKVSIDQEGDVDGVSDMIDIKTQAVIATFADNNNDSNHLADPLVAESIAKLKVSDSSIKSVTQPFASFNGKIAEESDEYYVRVSERLRHKQRAITIADYEKIVLEEYPSIYRVKCLNHTRFLGTSENYSELAPGHVSLVLVSKVKNQNAVDPLKPKTSITTLQNVEAFLEKIAPPCVSVEDGTLHIKNPIYEEIQANFNVNFHDQYDAGVYSTELNNDIIEFLSPWAFDSDTDISFGGNVHQSVILNFVEEREYVDYVTCFKINHIVNPDSEFKYTTPITPESDLPEGHQFNKNADEEIIGIKDDSDEIVVTFNFDVAGNLISSVDDEGNTITLFDVDEAEANTGASILGSAAEHIVSPIDGEECDCDENIVASTVTALSVHDCCD